MNRANSVNDFCPTCRYLAEIQNPLFIKYNVKLNELWPYVCCDKCPIKDTKLLLNFERVNFTNRYLSKTPPINTENHSEITSSRIIIQNDENIENIPSKNLEKEQQKSFKCNICDRNYSTKCLLNRHIEIHRPCKKYPCNKCSKGFNDAFDLKRHTRTHTGIRPFNCETCTKSFSQRCSLEAHMNRVHGNKSNYSYRERRPKLYVCEDCGLTFNQHIKYKDHLQTHKA